MKQIEEKIELYRQCIENGDKKVFLTLWDEKDVSLLVSKLDCKNNEVADVFLQNFIDKYENRRLQIFNTRYEVHGGVVVAVFEWIFDAHNKIEDIPYHSEGIESQVYCLMDGDYKLIHEHYHTYPLQNS